MNKKELVEILAKKMECSESHALKLVSTFLETIKEGLKENKSLKLVGFGTFSVVKRAARKTRIPNTNTVVAIPERKAVKFTPGKELKEHLNQQ